MDLLIPTGNKTVSRREALSLADGIPATGAEIFSAFFDDDGPSQSLERFERSLDARGADKNFGSGPLGVLNKSLQAKFASDSLQPKNVLDPEIANQIFGIPGKLSFNKPISRESARLEREIFLEEQREEDVAKRTFGIIDNSKIFGTALLGELLDPLGFAGAMFPIVPEARVSQLAAKLVGRGVGERTATIAARSAAGSFEGAVGTGIVGLPEHFVQESLQNPEIMSYSLAFDMVMGGVLGGILRPVIQGGIELTDDILKKSITEANAEAARKSGLPTPPDDALPDAAIYPPARIDQADNENIVKQATSQLMHPDSQGVDVTQTYNIAKEARKNSAKRSTSLVRQLNEKLEELVVESHRGGEQPGLETRILELIDEIQATDPKSIPVSIIELGKRIREEGISDTDRTAAFNQIIQQMGTEEQIAIRSSNRRNELNRLDETIENAKSDKRAAAGNLERERIETQIRQLLGKRMELVETILEEFRKFPEPTIKRVKTTRVAPIRDHLDELEVSLIGINDEIKKVERALDKLDRKAKQVPDAKTGVKRLGHADQAKRIGLNRNREELYTERARINSQIKTIKTTGNTDIDKDAAVRLSIVDSIRRAIDTIQDVGSGVRKLKDSQRDELIIGNIGKLKSDLRKLFGDNERINDITPDQIAGLARESARSGFLTETQLERHFGLRNTSEDIFETGQRVNIDDFDSVSTPDEIADDFAKTQKLKNVVGTEDSFDDLLDQQLVEEIDTFAEQLRATGLDEDAAAVDEILEELNNKTKKLDDSDSDLDDTLSCMDKS